MGRGFNGALRLQRGELETGVYPRRDLQHPLALKAWDLNAIGVQIRVVHDVQALLDHVACRVLDPRVTSAAWLISSFKADREVGGVGAAAAA